MLYSKPLDIQSQSIGEENRRRNRRMGSSSCLKFLVMIINFLFMLGGLGLLGAGVYALLAPSYLLSMLGSHLLRTLAILFIVTGSAVFLFSFLGCCGAKHESKCLLGVYILLIFLVFVMLVVCLIVLVTSQEEVKRVGANGIGIGLKHDYGFNNTFTDLFDRVQRDLRCCAVWTGQADYYQSTKWYHSQPHDDNRYSLPESCCLKSKSGAFVNLKKCQTVKPQTGKNSYYYTEGCVDALWDLWKNYRGYIVGSGAGVLVILFLLFVTTFVFMCQIRRHMPSGGIHV